MRMSEFVIEDKDVQDVISPEPVVSQGPTVRMKDDANAMAWFVAHYSTLRSTNKFPFPTFNQGIAVRDAMQFYHQDRLLTVNDAVAKSTQKQIAQYNQSHATAPTKLTQPEYDDERFRLSADGRKLKHDRFFRDQDDNAVAPGSPGLPMGDVVGGMIGIAKNTKNPFKAIHQGMKLGRNTFKGT